MSTAHEVTSDSFVRLSALAELKFNKYLIRTLLTQQLRITAVIEKQMRSSQDLFVIYHCTQEILQIMNNKNQLITELRDGFAQMPDPSNIILSEIDIRSNINPKCSSKGIKERKECKIENKRKIENVQSTNEIDSNSTFNGDEEYEESSSDDDESEEEFVNGMKIKAEEMVFKASKPGRKRLIFLSQNARIASDDMNDNACMFNDCSKMYKTRGGLLTHIRTAHLKTRTKSFKCKECNIGFYSNCHLQRHRRIHSGEQPFICCVCNKKFSQKVNWKTHLGTKYHKKNMGLEKNMRTDARSVRIYFDDSDEEEDQDESNENFANIVLTKIYEL